MCHSTFVDNINDVHRAHTEGRHSHRLCFAKIKYETGDDEAKVIRPVSERRGRNLEVGYRSYSMSLKY